MSLWAILGVVGAILFHAAILLFGGLLFPTCRPEHAALQEVELLGLEDEVIEDEEVKKVEPDTDSIETELAEAPDASEIIQSLEPPAAFDAPALDAASLSAIEAALSGATGGADFGGSLSFASGGRIGGTGDGSTLGGTSEDAFSLAEIDQGPRVVFQSSPTYPQSLRGRKIEGVVTLIFVVDASGKVQNPKIESSNNTAFDKPAIDALRRWKFDPAVRGTERVSCKMRVSIRFPPK
jgi:protein TonB